MAPVSGCLVIMCGVPCSGKSTAAAELASALSAKGIRTTTVDEPSLHLHRNAGYANGHVEKNTRGLLKATVDRSLHKDGPVVIVDACNGIKGYRYELWCMRTAGGRHGRASCTATHRRTTRARGTRHAAHPPHPRAAKEAATQLAQLALNPKSGADGTPKSSTTWRFGSNDPTERTEGTRHSSRSARPSSSRGTVLPGA